MGGVIKSKPDPDKNTCGVYYGSVLTDFKGEVSGHGGGVVFDNCRVDVIQGKTLAFFRVPAKQPRHQFV